MSEPPSIHPPDRCRAYRTSGVWPNWTLADRVTHFSRTSPDQVAIVDGTTGAAKTYQDLYADACRVAGFLSRRGVGIGTGVSVQLPNRYETVVVDVAAFMLGARLNPLLPNYRRKELQHVLTASEASVLVIPDEYGGFDHYTLGLELMASVSSLSTLLVVGDVPRNEWPSFRQALDSEPIPAPADADPGQISEIIFTSGTESSPKAVMHSEETLNHSAMAAAAHIGLSGDDVVWMPSPIGHSTGLNFGVRMALIHGLTCVLQDRWDASRAIELIETHRVTYTLAATTFLSDLIGTAEPEHDLSTLRHFGCGGAPVPKELVDAAAVIGIGVERLYGSTEALIVTWTAPDSNPDVRGMHDGEALADVEIKIWDDETGAPQPPGSAGEIIVRGPNVCLGFFQDPERTATNFDEHGWLRTGDLGVLDNGGHLAIVGRKKEIIIRGGLNIAPREIEGLILQHEAVADVAVIGVPDQRLGELMCACVVVNPDTHLSFEMLVSFLEGQGLAKYKLPQRLVLVDELARTPTGKLQKYEIQKAITVEAGE